MKNKRLENFLYSKYVSFIIIFVIQLSYCYLKDNPLLYNITYNLTLLLGAVVIVFYLLNLEISKIAMYFILYCAMLFLSTLLGDNTSMSTLLARYFKVIAIFFYLDYGLKYYCKNTVLSFYWALSILVIINFYTLIRFPDGLYSDLENQNKYWFFNHKNTHSVTFFATLMFMFIKSKLLDRKLNIFDLIVFLIITISVFKVFSATTVVAYIVFLIYLLFGKHIDKFNIFNSKNYFLSYIAVFWSIVILRLQNLFSFIIVDVLGKKLTFTGRTLIWDRVINLMKEHWVLGHGQQDKMFIAKALGHPNFNSAHNTTLDVLYKGGLISLILHIIMVILPIKELYKYRENKIAKFMSVILFCFFIMLNFEARNEYSGFYMILLSCYHISYILKNINENKEVN